MSSTGRGETRVGLLGLSHPGDVGWALPSAKPFPVLCSVTPTPSFGTQQTFLLTCFDAFCRYFCSVSSAGSPGLVQSQTLREVGCGGGRAGGGSQPRGLPGCGRLRRHLEGERALGRMCTSFPCSRDSRGGCCQSAGQGSAVTVGWKGQVGIICFCWIVLL